MSNVTNERTKSHISDINNDHLVIRVDIYTSTLERGWHEMIMGNPALYLLECERRLSVRGGLSGLVWEIIAADYVVLVEEKELITLKLWI